jgi:hypothetical protein
MSFFLVIKQKSQILVFSEVARRIKVLLLGAKYLRKVKERRQRKQESGEHSITLCVTREDMS